MQKGQITKVCKVVKIEVIGKSPHVKYKYHFEGKTFYGNNSYNKKWTKEKGEFYYVKISLSNPEISEIIQNMKPLNPLELISNGNIINGDLINMKSTFKNYVDLFVRYNIKGKTYTVRTRKHIDSLPCGNLENCNKTKVIPVRIAENFPSLNNLYFESVDRKQEFVKLKTKFNIQ